MMDKIQELFEALKTKDSKNWKTTILGTIGIVFALAITSMYLWGKITQEQYSVATTTGGSIIGYLISRVARDAKPIEAQAEAKAEQTINNIEVDSSQKVDKKDSQSLVNQANKLFVILLMLTPTLGFSQAQDSTTLLRAGSVYNNTTGKDVAVVPISKLRKIVAMKLSYDSLKEVYQRDAGHAAVALASAKDARSIMSIGANVSMGGDFLVANNAWGFSTGVSVRLGFLDAFGVYVRPMIIIDGTPKINYVVSSGIYINLFNWSLK